MSKADYQVPDSRPWFKLYGADVSRHLDYPDVTLNHFIDEAAAEHPEKIALSFYGTNITYREYGELVDKFCHALMVNGIQKGDRVIIMAVNCPQTIISIMGTMKAGAIPVPLNPLYTPKELEYFFKDLQPRLVVTLDNFYSNVTLAAQVTPQIEKIISTNISDYFPPMKRMLARALKKVEVFNCHEAVDFKSFLEMAPHYAPDEDMNKEGVFYIEGRKDDMINVRGEKVWPREVEQVLEKHPKVLDVAVIGVPSDYYGQAVKACVVLKQGETATEKDLMEFAKESLVPHKVPVMIEFFSELPKSNIGKTLHSVLRRRESEKQSK